MDANDYQVQAARTLIDGMDRNLRGHDLMLIWIAIGLAGEAGEIANHCKKAILHDHGLELGKLKEECGDLAWYLAAMCTQLGLSLEDVMQANIEKLHRRYPREWSSADSIARKDKDHV